MKKYILPLIIVVLLFIIPLQFKKKELPEVVQECEISITFAESSEAMPLEQYLVGVLAGEMPASFELEALKAQAIAARTYAVHQTNYGASPIKQTTAHQVYKEELDPKYEKKLKQAVKETKDQILTYDGQPITAMFHAASNGQTETSENFSGTQIDYLVAVTSPEEHTDVETFTLAQFNQALQGSFTLAQINQAKIIRNSTNRVETITIGKRSWTGREFRELMKLKSADFTITADTAVHIQTKGYGHGVGMSQHGAEILATQGKNAEEIVRHYYPNTKLEQLSCSK
ncbi:MAG: stage II sporulation protein D [Lysinibacillus sp.]